ncbi:L10-interacting MYB domain-containing protein-like [Senna tora]|uniref:L10-interacting MYB domain-containing protein-like n=1 Tax=Senna tora TaxID=362788 RepID=A0A834XBZ1_9FABA|nr:L10-interacting MYB domain-containing protein-like [Senna tora]
MSWQMHLDLDGTLSESLSMLMMLFGTNTSSMLSEFCFSIQTHPKAAGWLHNAFPHYDELTKVWAKDRATSIGMENTNDMYEGAYTPEPLPEETTEAALGVNEDVYYTEMNPEQGPEASSSSSKKRKRACVDRD